MRGSGALLGRLALEPGTTVRTGRLIADLWGEDAPEAARKRLHVAVARLRRTLDESGDDGAAELLVTTADGYLLRLADGQLDVHHFERLVDEGRMALAAGDADIAAATLARALALWRGPALGDVALGPLAGAQVGQAPAADWRNRWWSRTDAGDRADRRADDLARRNRLERDGSRA